MYQDLHAYNYSYEVPMSEKHKLTESMKRMFFIGNYNHEPIGPDHFEWVRDFHNKITRIIKKSI